MFGWAHANATPGDPGAGPIDNTADMLGFGVRHWLTPKTTLIFSYAHMSNGLGAHYALGPGGHGARGIARMAVALRLRESRRDRADRKWHRLLYRNEPASILARHDARLLSVSCA